jgi:hypothetical protein
MKTTTTAGSEEMANLKAFAEAVLARCEKAEAGMKFGRKTFVAALQPSKVTREMLVKAHVAGYLRLSRCDMSQIFPRDLVAASEVKHMHAAFHFVSAM